MTWELILYSSGFVTFGLVSSYIWLDFSILMFGIHTNWIFLFYVSTELLLGHYINQLIQQQPLIRHLMNHGMALLDTTITTTQCYLNWLCFVGWIPTFNMILCYPVIVSLWIGSIRSNVCFSILWDWVLW
jgi:hypothetical protein